MPRLADNELAQLVEYGEAEAWADLQMAAAVALDVQVERVESAVVLVAPTIPIMLFNRVVGLGVRTPATVEQVAAIAAIYRQAGVENYAVQVSPAAQPDGVREWLEAYGLRPRDNWVKVYRAVNPPVEVATDLRIEAITPALRNEFATVASSAFGMPASLGPMLASVIGRPRWTHYLAFDGERAVATAALFVNGDVGWLGIGSTLPTHRRRGAQGALMAQRIHDAAAQGCRWLVTETGEESAAHPNPSFHNMLRTGFEVAYLRPNYVSPIA